MQKILSIIIPCYNCASTIERCINSIPNSSLIDIIAVNDGSTDNTLKILKDIKNKNKKKNIIVIDQKNSGVSNARNIGIEKSNSKWICFLDSDDYYNKNEFLSLFNLLQNSKYDVINYSGYRIYPNGKKVPIIKQKYKKEFIIEDGIRHFLNYDNYMNYINWGPCLHFYKSDIIIDNKIRFIKSRSFGEDVLFNMEYFINVKNVYSSSQNIYNYYQSEMSLTRSGYNEKLLKEITNYIEDITNILKKNNKNIKEYQNDLKNFYLFQFQFLIMNESKSNNKNVGINNIKKYINFYDYKNVKYRYLNKISKISLFLIKTKFYCILYIILRFKNRGGKK